MAGWTSRLVMAIGLVAIPWDSGGATARRRLSRDGTASCPIASPGLADADRASGSAVTDLPPHGANDQRERRYCLHRPRDVPPRRARLSRERVISERAPLSLREGRHGKSGPCGHGLDRSRIAACDRSAQQSRSDEQPLPSISFIRLTMTVSAALLRLKPWRLLRRATMSPMKSADSNARESSYSSSTKLGSPRRP